MAAESTIIANEEQQKQDALESQVAAENQEKLKKKDSEPEPAADGAGARQGGGKGADIRRTTREKHADLEGAQDQRESIDHAQQKLRKTGKGEKIRSTEKSKQNEKKS